MVRYSVGFGDAAEDGVVLNGRKKVVCLPAISASSGEEAAVAIGLTNDILGAHDALLKFALDGRYIEVPDGAFLLVQDAVRDLISCANK